MKILMAMMQHETNTFSTVPTPLARFSRGNPAGVPWEGQAAVKAFKGTGSALGAYIEICEAEGVHPTMFYQWQKTFFEKGSAVFEAGRSPSRLVGKTERKLAVLEDQLRRKDEVIAEIMEDLVRTKNLGES